MAAGKELFKLFGVIGMQGVEKTQKDIRKIDKQIRKTQKEIDRLGRKVSDVGKVFIKGFTAPLLIAGVAITKIAADFDAAFTKSTAIMGDLSDTLKTDLKNAAIEVSKVVAFSAKEAAEAYFFLASAGKTAAQSIGLLPVVAKFAQAGAFNLALATDLLTDAQSALGLAAKDTAEDLKNMIRVSDVLVKANTLANATVAQFSESLTNKAGAALRVLGKDIEEGAAVLAVFADQGLKGAAAGESLNIVLRDFQRASLNNESAFKAASVAVFDQNGEMRNMADIIGELDALLLGMSDKQRRATLSTLGFQDKSISATMALLGTADAIKEYEKELRKAAGTTDDVANKQLKTFWKQLGLIKDRLIAVGLTAEGFANIGNDVVLPVLDKITRLVEGLSRRWNGLSVSARKTAKGFIVIVAALGPAVFLIGKLIGWSKVLVPLLVALKTGTLGYAGALAVLQKSTMAMTLLIGALVAVGWFWFSQWDQISAGMQRIWARVVLVVKEGTNEIVQIVTDWALNVIGVIDKVGSAVPGLSDKLKTARIAILKFKAAMFKDLSKQERLANNLADQAEAQGSISDAIKDSVKQAKEALGVKEEGVKTTQKQIGKELELAKQAKKTAEQRIKFNQGVNEELARLGKDRLELLEIERQQAVEEAKKMGADVSAVNRLFHTKKQEIQQEEAETRKQFNTATLDELDTLLLTELELLEQQKQTKLEQASELGADEFAIKQLFLLKEQELRDKQRKEEKAKEKQRIRDTLNQTSKLGNKINGVLSKFSDNKLMRLDNEEKRQIDAIERSGMTEEQKEHAIQKIQEETEKKRRVMERQRAVREKAAALFNIGINTASAVVEALPNIPLAVIVGALGLAESVAVATAPLPFFEGAMIEGSDRGVNAIIGEQNQDEIVFPLERGIALLLDGLTERLGGTELPAFAAPAPGLAAADGGGSREVHLHIGTFIGDDRGLKMLERKLDSIRIAENQRKGF